MFKKYQRKGLSEMRPYIPGEDLSKVSVNPVDKPEEGGMIARNPLNHEDQWYVAKKYFLENLEEVSDSQDICERKCDKDFNGLLEVGKGTFGMAVEAMKHGQKVARKGWNGAGMFLYLVPGSTFEVNREPLLSIYEEGTKISYRPHMDLKTADGSIATWSPSGSDALAEDWILVK